MNSIKRIIICLITLFLAIRTQAQIENLDLYDYLGMSEAEAISKFDMDYKDSIIVSVDGINRFFSDNKYAFIENLVTKHHVSPKGFLENINNSRLARLRCGVDMKKSKAPSNPITCKPSKSYEANEYTKIKLHLVDVLMLAGDAPTKKSFRSCVEANELEILKLFVQKNGGGIPDQQVAEDMLVDACGRGNMSFVTYLIDIGVSPNAKDASLFYAIYRAVSYPDIFFYLISKGADYEVVGYNLSTPILHAAREGCLEVVQFFVDKKVDPYSIHGSISAITMAKKYNKKNGKEVVALLKQVKK
jgi:hypothetical protein